MPWFEIECPRCSSLVPECDLCNGTGRVGIDRCPNATVPEIYRRTVGMALETEQGAWPEAGGLLDQAAWFVAARGHVLRLVGEWRQKCRRAPDGQ